MESRDAAIITDQLRIIRRQLELQNTRVTFRMPKHLYGEFAWTAVALPEIQAVYHVGGEFHVLINGQQLNVLAEDVAPFLDMLETHKLLVHLDRMAHSDLDGATPGE